METCSISRFMRTIYMSSKLQMNSLDVTNKKRGERYPFSLDQRTTDNWASPTLTKAGYTQATVAAVATKRHLVLRGNFHKLFSPFTNYFLLSIVNHRRLTVSYIQQSNYHTLLVVFLNFVLKTHYTPIKHYMVMYWF